MKDVLVTGAYGGMGRAAVEDLCKNGFRVFALDINVDTPCQNVVPIKCDVTCEQSIKAAFDAVKEHTKELYAVIHFAGIYMLDSLVEMDSDSFRKIFDINLYGAFLINRTFLPLLRKGSRIVITTSELAPLDPLPFTGIYAVTKSALDKYAYSLRMELQLLGIKVSVLRAGAVDTGMLGVSTNALDNFCGNTRLYACNAERFKKIVNKVEARNIPPSEIAKKVIKIIKITSPKFAYSINRNPLLLLLDLLPQKLQFYIIGLILK